MSNGYGYRIKGNGRHYSYQGAGVESTKGGKQDLTKVREKAARADRYQLITLIFCKNLLPVHSKWFKLTAMVIPVKSRSVYNDAPQQKDYPQRPISLITIPRYTIRCRGKQTVL